MKKIVIDTIPNNTQRYPTLGDYYEESGELKLKISDCSNPCYEFAIAIHELIEQKLCELAGIKEEDITKFDMMFEEECKQGLHPNDDEPGEDPRAPYKKQHFIATIIEMMVIKEMGIDWEKYLEDIYALFDEEEVSKTST
jgi:hypothetical protein